MGSQDAFCGAGSSSCVVFRIYDQSPQGNHLCIEHGRNINPLRNIQDLGVNFTDPRSVSSLGGQKVYGAFFEGCDPAKHGGRCDNTPFIGQGYSNRSARGTAVGDDPETLYAVFGGQHYDNNCCFDYGNAETWDGRYPTKCVDGTMEAISFRGDMYGHHRGDRGIGGSVGGWVGADLENGIYGYNSTVNTTNFEFVTAMLKGNSGNHYAIKVGNAQKAGSLVTTTDGPRPAGYAPMKKQGAIILGIGGDNSPWAGGLFFEGVMTKGYTSDEVDAAVAANIVAAGYGR